MDKIMNALCTTYYWNTTVVMRKHYTTARLWACADGY